MQSLGIWTPLLGLSLVASALASACVVERERPAQGMHPEGFVDEESANFHGVALKKQGYPLDDCRVCHGDDYQGGVTGVSCSGNCHSKGVEACDGCHGEMDDPLPKSSGAHAKHAMACTTCHVVPESAREETHPNGNAEVRFTGLGLLLPEASFSPTLALCANVYCHGGKDIKWEALPDSLPCDACHSAPPESHARFHVEPAPSGCASCHPIPSAEMGDTHVNGVVDFLPMNCTTCHGQGPLGMPPPSLSGESAPSAAGVGAHVRHVDGTLSDRIGKAMSCEACHPVPATVDAKGHLDTTAPADVSFLVGGSYDGATGRCVTSCHWDKDPGPAWTDTSGAAKACNACHGLPLLKTRNGTAHSPATDPATCVNCHLFDPARHVDGHVDFKP